MTENQKYEVLRKQKVEELTKQLKALLPKILERYTFNEDKPDDLKSQELSLNAKIGSKNNTYLNITNDVITSPDQYVSMWFDGLLNHIEVVDKGMEEIRAAYNFQQLLVNDDDLMQYTILFLKRTYWRNCYSISKIRPTEKDAELWIGQKNETQTYYYEVKQFPFEVELPKGVGVLSLYLHNILHRRECLP